MNLSHLPRVNARGDKQRDNQRQKLYTAERESLVEWSVVVGDGSVAAAQTYVDALCRERWFQVRWGQQTIPVRQKTHGRATANQISGYITLPPWSRCPRVILHEVAHIICPPEYAWHGPEFAARMLLLVRFHLGVEAAAKLREGYAKQRVKHREGVRSLPEPNPDRVLTQAIVVARLRKAANKPVGPVEARTAADVLRRAVKQGLLGAVGTKERNYALAAARRLEEHSR